MGKAKMTVTIDDVLVGELDRLSKQRKESRSSVVEEAVRYWQRELEKQRLIEGYQAMAREDVEMAESNIKAGLETQR